MVEERHNTKKKEDINAMVADSETIEELVMNKPKFKS